MNFMLWEFHLNKKVAYPHSPLDAVRTPIKTPVRNQQSSHIIKDKLWEVG